MKKLQTLSIYKIVLKYEKLIEYIVVNTKLKLCRHLLCSLYNFFINKKIY